MVRALAALLENEGWSPSHPHGSSNYLSLPSQESVTFFWPPSAEGAYVEHRRTCGQNTHKKVLGKNNLRKSLLWLMVQDHSLLSLVVKVAGA